MLAHPTNFHRGCAFDVPNLRISYIVALPCVNEWQSFILQMINILSWCSGAISGNRWNKRDMDMSICLQSSKKMCECLLSTQYTSIRSYTCNNLKTWMRIPIYEIVRNRDRASARMETRHAHLQSEWITFLRIHIILLKKKGSPFRVIKNWRWRDIWHTEKHSEMYGILSGLSLFCWLSIFNVKWRGSSFQSSLRFCCFWPSD